MARRLGALVGLALLAGGLLAIAGSAGTGAFGGTPAPAAFRLKDATAGCNFLASGALACRATGAPAAVVLSSSGRSRVADVAVYWDDATPVLRPSTSWWNGAFSCRVADARISCATLEGAAISVGEGRIAGLAAPTRS